MGRSAVPATLIACILLSGCPAPYSLSIAEYNDRADPSVATILVGDAQVYARESLINDRRDEREHLETLLRNSRTVPFEPQLLRSLRIVEALRANAALRFDPVARRNSVQDREIADLEHTKKVVQLQNDIEKARAETIGNANSSQTPEAGLKADPRLELTQEMAKLKTLVGQLVDSLSTLKAEDPSVRAVQTAVKADPHDEFRDREAYRAELRSALAAANLDDLHDYSGRVLYRLQFRAALLPGEHRDQVGIARLTMNLVDLTDQEWSDLYRAWLGHVASRLHRVSAFHSHVGVDEEIKLLGELSGLFRVYEYPQDAVRAAASRRGVPVDRAQRWRFAALGPASIHSCDPAAAFLAASTSISMRGWPSEARQVLAALRADGGDSYFADCAKVPPKSNWFPASFKTLLESAPVAGHAYGIRPLERGQRMSTTASAATSLELAIAASIAFPGQGVGADADAGYLRSAVGNAEARERLPLVIGYSDRAPSAGRKSGSVVSQFGWVFPPRAQLDPAAKSIRLVHLPASHEVAADISVPAWWPRAEFNLETGWVGRWQNSRDPLPLAGSGQPLTVNLPTLSQGNMEALTTFIARRTGGLGMAEARITYVQPELLSACSSSVRFLIYGNNLWRSADVQFAGRPAKKVEVLPDMKGIAAEFELDEIYGTRRNTGLQPNVFEQARLTVSTRDNFAEWFIKIAGSRGPDGCDAPLTFVDRQPTDRSPAILSLVPAVAHVCGGSATFFAEGRELEASGNIRLGPLKGEIARIGAGSGVVGTWTFSFAGIPDVPRGVLPMVYADDRGLTSTVVELRNCDGSEGLSITERKAGTIRVEANASLVVEAGGNARIIANVAGLPKSSSKLELVVRPVNDDRWVSAGEIVERNVASTGGVVNFAFAATDARFANGTVLTLAIAETPSPTSRPIYHLARRKVVLYKSEAASKIRLVASGAPIASLALDPAAMKLTLLYPANAGIAYPGFDPGTAVPILVDGAADLAVEAGACERAGAEQAQICTYPVKAGNAAKFAQARAGGELTYSVKLDKAKAGWPSVEGKVTLPKSN